VPEEEGLSCMSCAARYPVFGEIADFRVARPIWLDVDQDRRKASRLLALAGHVPVRDLVVEVFRQRGWSQGDVEHRTALIIEGPERFARDLETWLHPATTGRRPFLDLGCGAGPLLAAAARLGRPAVGIDVSLEWLVVAGALIREHGGVPILAAALGEALPFADGSLGGVVSLDVIEHVEHQGDYLREIGRVVMVGGVAAIATPNRYSLSAEPHVSLWGVGWLPRRWQERYVNWRSGKSYASCRLLSLRELRRLVRDHAGMEPTVLLGEVPAGDIARFKTRKAWLARAYNRLLRIPPARAAMISVCPFFRVLATRLR
jgi:SAM-dependent methyltransferase